MSCLCLYFSKNLCDITGIFGNFGIPTKIQNIFNSLSDLQQHEYNETGKKVK